MNLKIHLIIAMALCSNFICFSQDVEQKWNSIQQRMNEDPLRITGSFSAMGQAYSAFGIPNRAIPLNGRILAALNFDLLGIQMPLSVAISNGGIVYNRRLPSYSFVGISPSYKWAKLLIGTRNLDYGKYSFSNHSFTGAGVELTPGNMYFSAFYGRLRRARIEDFQGINNVDPFFRRMGFGGKIGYQDGKDKAMLSIFKAWDDGASVPLMARDSLLNTFPSENVILSGEISKQIGKKLELEINYSNSGFTDKRDLSASDRSYTLSSYGGLLSRNISSRVNDAFETQLKYKLKTLTLTAGYERIDPGYRTMGALFFNNDLENISGGANAKFLKNRIILNGRAGIQRNNLNNDQANRYRRFVGSLNGMIRPTDKLSITGNISNFNNVNRRLAFVDIDTLNLVTNLVLSTINSTVGFNLVLANNAASISSLQGSLTRSDGLTIENDEVQEDQVNANTSANLNYYCSWNETGWSYGALTSYQRNTLGEITNTFTTLGVNVGKSLLQEKLTTRLNTSFSWTNQASDLESAQSGRVFSGQFSVAYKVNDNNAIIWQSGYLFNQVMNSQNVDRSFSEFRSTINYTYTFNNKG